MADRFICCATCQRRWPVAAQECTYLDLEVMTRPCPHCEAYTLSVRADSSVRKLRRRRLAAAIAQVTRPIASQS